MSGAMYSKLRLFCQIFFSRKHPAALNGRRGICYTKKPIENIFQTDVDRQKIALLPVRDAIAERDRKNDGFLDNPLIMYKFFIKF